MLHAGARLLHDIDPREYDLTVISEVSPGGRSHIISPYAPTGTILLQSNTPFSADCSATTWCSHPCWPAPQLGPWMHAL
jgi:hypothetical protein